MSALIECLSVVKWKLLRRSADFFNQRIKGLAHQLSFLVFGFFTYLTGEKE